MNKLCSIFKPDGAKADVVFIHGLDGDAYATWQHNPNDQQDSWPFWLANELQDVAVHSLSYAAAPHLWLGPSMPLAETAENLLAVLLSDGDIGDRPLVLVGHSMGGLVIKQILRKTQDRQAIAAWRKLGAATKAVVFLGTPHRGAKLATYLERIGQSLGITPSPSVDDLRRHGELLIDLNDWYGANAKSMGIETHCFYETKGAGGVYLPNGVLIVEKDSGDIDVPDIPSYPVEVDHIAISKPPDQDDVRYGYLIRVIKTKIAEPPADLFDLKAPKTDFVGRKTDIERIRNALQNKGGAVITALKGMGGIGKTATGVEVAQQLRKKGAYPDGVHFVDLDGFNETVKPKTAEAALAELLRPLVGVEAKLPDDLAGLQLLWHQRTSGLAMLLFLDNARDEGQIQPLLPGHETCRVLATSRNTLRLKKPPITSIELGTLTPDDAVALALKLGNRGFDEEPRLTDAQAARLAKICAYLPFAIEVTAGTLNEEDLYDVTTYLDRLEKAVLSVEAMDKVKAAIRCSLDLLQEETRRRWRKLGVFEGDFSTDAAGAVWETEAPEDTLVVLKRRSLLTVDDQQRCKLHDILRALALEALPADEHETAAARHAAHYLQVLGKCDRLYQLKGQIIEGLRLYDLEKSEIQAGQSWAAQNLTISDEAAFITAEYPDAGHGLLTLRLIPCQRITWLEDQIEACRRLKYRRGEGYALGNLGIAFGELGQYERSISFYEEALEIYREFHDRQSESKAYGALGSAHFNLGRTKLAIELYEKRLEIAKEVCDRRGEGIVIGNLGNAYSKLGQSEKAISFHKCQLKIAREVDNLEGEAEALGNLGYDYSARGEKSVAIKYWNKSLTIAQKIGHQRCEGIALHNLGGLHYQCGEHNQAVECYRKKLEIDFARHDQLSAIMTLQDGILPLGKIGKWTEARAWTYQAIAIHLGKESPTEQECNKTLAEWTSKFSAESPYE